jgi:hypothetical protein
MALSHRVDEDNMRLPVRLPAPFDCMQVHMVRLAVVVGLVCSGAAGLAQGITAFPASTAVGQSSTPLAVTVTMTVGGVAAAPKAFTQGLSTGEFSVAAGGTCSAGTSYAVGGQCSVDVVFKPGFPGVRAGAVVVATGNGTEMGTALLGGVGTSALPVLAPGLIETVAGNAEWIYEGDGSVATSSPIFLPTGVVSDAAGNLFLSDSQNQRIRRVDAVTGVMSTIAGTGSAGYNGDGLPATQTQVNTPAGLVLDGAGNLYYADTGNHIVRRVDANTGIVTTVAGTAGVQGYGGDGAAATQGRLAFPQSVVFDAAGNLLIADTSNNAVRKVDVRTGVLTTIAGTGLPGYNGDGQAATAARLNSPWGIAVGQDGSVYIADLFNDRVRQVHPSGMITTVAGTGVKGFSGDGGPATQAQLAQPTALALDPAGDLYLADSDNDRVRAVSALDGSIVTLSGTGGEQFDGDGGPANLASLYGPDALYFDPTGTLFVADMFHNRIRRISGLKTLLLFVTMKEGKISPPQPVTVANDGNADMMLAMPALVNAATDAATTTCAAGNVVPAGGTCVEGVEFAPTMTGNPVTGSVTVTSDAGTTAPLINLSGEVLSITPTTLALTSSQNPSLVGAKVTFTATIGNDGGTLTGTIVFYNGTTQLCSVTVTGGGAACATSALTLGQNSITAVYGGDANDAAATSAALIQEVQQADSLVLTATPNPVVVTASMTMTLTITAPTGTATGTATFYDGTTPVGAGTVSTSGVADFPTSSLTPGTHMVSASYAGNATNVAGKSNVVNVVVQQATTSTTLTSSNPTAIVGTAVTFTATVASANGPTPTGTVQFTDGGVALGTGPVGSNGQATFTTSSLTPGTHSIAAVYEGNPDDATSTSVAISEVIEQIDTTTLLGAAPNPASAGVTVNLTATVALVGTGPVGLKGKVTFSDGSTLLGSATLNGSGQATLGVSTLTAGPHSITAAYAGSKDYAESTSAAVNVVITSTATTTALSSTATTTYAGQTASFSATVTSPTDGLPTGTVTFADGGVNIGQGTLNGQGVASFSTTTLNVGQHTLKASYGGDGSYNASTSAQLVHTVVLAPTTTALTSSLNPATLGASVTFTASVASSSASPGGTVSFFDGTTALGSGTVGANGVATLSTAGLAFGVHSITAVYQGDTTHATSTSGGVSERIVEVAAASLTSSMNPVIYGNAFTLTARVAGSGSLVATGNILFSEGGTTLGAAALDGTGAATLSPTGLAVGSHTITASYGGDTNFSATTATLIETVTNSTTQVVLTASATTVTYLAAETFSATVTGNGGAATGTVTFTDGGVSIGTAELNGSGVGAVTLTTLTPGSHSIVANYAGNANVGASVSTPVAISVKEATTMTLASNADPSPTLAGFTITAGVMNAGVGVPTGTVTFMDGATLLGTAAVDGTGHAALNIASMSAGDHALTASYAGDTDDLAGASPTLTETVQLRPTTVALTGSATDAADPQQVTLIAVVGWTGPAAPTGTVAFGYNGAVLGSAPVGSNGLAVLTVTFSAASESIVATYAGNTAYAGSVSAVTTVTGTAPALLTVVLDPPAMTFGSGKHSTGTMTLISQSGFADTMALGCDGLPFAATCTFSKTQVALAANSYVTAQITVDTGDPLGAGGSAAVRGQTKGVMLCFLPWILGVGFGWRRRGRGWPALLLLVCAGAVTLGATGCSGLHINSTPAGTYTFKVTATGMNTGTSQSQTMTLTVTQ